MIVPNKFIEVIGSNCLERNTKYDEEQAIDFISFVLD